MAGLDQMLKNSLHALQKGAYDRDDARRALADLSRLRVAMLTALCADDASEMDLCTVMEVERGSGWGQRAAMQLLTRGVASKNALSYVVVHVPAYREDASKRIVEDATESASPEQLRGVLAWSMQHATPAARMLLKDGASEDDLLMMVTRIPDCAAEAAERLGGVLGASPRNKPQA